MSSHKIFCLIGIIFLYGCTENPFFKDEIKTPDRTLITGNVKLNNSNDNSGIIVYFEGYDILTKTDRRGNFKIDLSLEPLQSGKNVTGFFNIYYYVANYKLAASTIFVNNGKFGYGMADLSYKGEIVPNVVLKQLLDVRTIVNPGFIEKSYPGYVVVTVRLESKVDSVIVYSHLAKDGDLASAFLKDQNDNVFLFGEAANLKERVIKSVKFWTMPINWPYEGNKVKVGLYEIIPYLYIYQSDIPADLINRVGINATRFTPDYIKLPFRRNTATLSITEPDSL